MKQKHIFLFILAFCLVATSAYAGADANITNVLLTAAACTTTSNFNLTASADCIGETNCSLTYSFGINSSFCSYVAGIWNESGVSIENGSSWTSQITVVCTTSAIHHFHFNATNEFDSKQTALANTTCSAGGGGLTADQGSCILTGEYTNGTLCAVGEVKRMGSSLAVMLFVLLINAGLFALGLGAKKYVSYKSKATTETVNFIIKRSVLAAAIYMLVLVSAIAAKISDTAQLGLNQEMFFFMEIFGWAGYVALIVLVTTTIFKVYGMYTLGKEKERFGDDD